MATDGGPRRALFGFGHRGAKKKCPRPTAGGFVKAPRASGKATRDISSGVSSNQTKFQHQSKVWLGMAEEKQSALIKLLMKSE